MRVADAALSDGKLSTFATVDRRSPAPRATPEPPAPEEPSPFARILTGLGREVDRGEALVRRVAGGTYGGREIGNLELLSLQAGVYRYSEAVDLSAKLVDRASSGVKTVIQGQ